MLSDHEHRLIARNIASLDALLDVTPQSDAASGKATLVIVTKMLLALGSQKTNEAGAEAKGEAYMMVLDDIPSWAVAAAVRGWYRGESAGQHDFRWAPAPAVLRQISLTEMWRVKSRSQQLRLLLEAEPLIEYSLEHRTEMLEKISKVMKEATKQGAI